MMTLVAHTLGYRSDGRVYCKAMPVTLITDGGGDVWMRRPL
jgi:hypothetical protein